MVDQVPPAAWPDLAAGPATAASLCALVTVDAGRLSGAQLVDAVVCAEKAVSLLLGVQARLLSALAVPFVAGDPMRLAAKLARRSGLGDGMDDERDDQIVQAMVPEAAQSLAAGEIAAALRIAPVTAGIRVRNAVALTEEFAPAREALEDGVLDRGKLRAVMDQVQVLPAEQIGPVLDQVLPEVADRCTSEIREITAQAVITADPDGATDRHRQAAARRELTLSPGTDAMATLKAFLPADGAVKIFQVSDLLATGTAGVPGDHRGIGARRVDALIDLADRLLSDGHIDLTGFIGQPLPDPTSPTHRPRRASHTRTRTGRGGGLIDPAGTRGATTRRPTGDHDDPTEHHHPTGRTTTANPATTIHLADPAPTANPTTTDHPADPDRAVAGGPTEAGNQPTTADAAAADDPPENAGGSGPEMARHTHSNGPARPDTSPTTNADPPEPPDPDNHPAADDEPADPATARHPTDPDHPSNPTDPDHPSTPTGRPALTRQGRRPHLTVTLSLDTLAGLNELPAALAGYGSIPADLARSIAASAGTITAALTDPTTGAVTTAGELTYRPRQALRDQSAARTDTCQFPSCRQPVWRCDLDHRQPFDHRHPDQGGRTTLDNSGALCRRHHLFKDHADWQLTVDTSRLTVNWTSPTGHTYTRRARQTAPPAAWIRTTATTIAQRLDDIAATHALHTDATLTGTRYPTADHPTPETGHPTEPNPTGTDHPTGDTPPTGTDHPTGDTPPTGQTASTSSSSSSSYDTAAPTEHCGTFEDRLTDAVLRHALSNPQQIEYQPGQADERLEQTPPTVADAAAGPEDPDEPPF
ncbi:DUF222 domain-containing protein [Nakamurella sp.]|uniref:HNH endonuclease n=1 Tax=Nakamurella sp. TaxID=1869182 RepID=UPI003783AA79